MDILPTLSKFSRVLSCFHYNVIRVVLILEGTTEYHNTLDIKKRFSEREIEHVKELPSTSYISAWARFTNDLTMEELYKVMLTY